MRRTSMTNRRRRSDRGTAAVEFALVLPLLLSIVLGTIDFGYYFFITQVLTNAAREGARTGSVYDTSTAAATVQDAMKAAVDNYVTKGGLSSGSITYTTNQADSAAKTVKIVVTYPVGSLTKFLTSFLPATAKATSVMTWQ